MSSQRGNSQRSRPQKHKNAKAFKNNTHDTSKKTALINQLEMHGLCARCKAIIEWKVKYKKYKPLSKPATCVRCSQRNIGRAYFILCETCMETLKVCGKCGKATEIVIPVTDPELAEIDRQFETNLRNMRERERRSILRIMESKKDRMESGVDKKLKKLTIRSSQPIQASLDSEDEECVDDESQGDNIHCHILTSRDSFDSL
uniref:Chromosome 9 open reading frame 85 n=1 Tax=Mesocestoides corti TaxID=53468 RepID=A0A5K3FT71_MESCO